VKIVKIGTFDSFGNPTGWTVDCENCGGNAIAITDNINVHHALGIMDDGRVTVNGVEIVEWTEARKRAVKK